MGAKQVIVKTKITRTRTKTKKASGGGQKRCPTCGKYR